MLHVNLLRWHHLIGSLSRDIGQYPEIEFSNSGYCFHGKRSRFASGSEEKICIYFDMFNFGLFTCSILKQIFTSGSVNSG